MRTTELSFTTTLDFGVLGEHEVEVEYSYSPGRPARMYLRNGDPGYPADPPEAELISLTIVQPDGYQGPDRAPRKRNILLPSEVCDLLSEDVLERLLEQAFEHAAGLEADYHRAEAEADYERRHEEDF